MLNRRSHCATRTSISREEHPTHWCISLFQLFQYSIQNSQQQSASRRAFLIIRKRCGIRDQPSKGLFVYSSKSEISIWKCTGTYSKLCGLLENRIKRHLMHELWLRLKFIRLNFIKSTPVDLQHLRVQS